MNRKIYSFFPAILFVSLVAFPFFVMAAPVSNMVAEETADSFLDTKDRRSLSAQKDTASLGDVPSVHAVSEMIELLDDSKGEILAYILVLDPKGFVVIAPDTDLPPVIAYSFENDFDMSDSPHNALLHMLTWDMQNRLAALPVTDQSLIEGNQELWADYLGESSSYLSEDAPGVRYGPMISTAWEQSSPYNALCPMDPDTGQTSLVGCVATAMAQIINYHQYPSSVIFTSADNYTTTTRGINITASGASIPSISYPASSVMAARLSYACGVSVEMDYTSSNSTAYPSATAFTGKFQYCDAKIRDGSASDLYTKLQSNMQSGYPAMLWIRDQANTQAHEIAIDGWDSSTGQYHCNFGWGGTNDSWYTLPSGLPSGYSVVVEAVVDIKPCNQPSCPELYSWNGDGYVSEGFIFASTHAPISESYQEQAVRQPVVPKDGAFSFVLKEVEDEESYINSASMLCRYVGGPSEGWFPMDLLSATHSRLGDVRDLITEKDGKRVHTISGDEIVLRYELPALWEFFGLEFKCVSSGYYLWTNDIWCQVLDLGPALVMAPGKQVTFEALVNNISTLDIPEEAKVWFVIEDGNDTEAGPMHTLGFLLPPGTPHWFYYNWTVPDDFQAGTYAYTAKVMIGDTNVTWNPENYGGHAAQGLRTIGPVPALCHLGCVP